RRDETRPPGLAIKSSAPSSSALNTLRSLDFEETAITAVGRLCISQRRKAKPSITGISRSRVTTSGRCRMACLMPSSPLTAVATTHGGGIAIVVITLIGSAPWMTPRIAIVAVAALVIAVVSWIDDVRHLPAMLRLGVQIAAALPVVVLFGPLWLAPLALLWI